MILKMGLIRRWLLSASEMVLIWSRFLKVEEFEQPGVGVLSLLSFFV